MHIELVCCGLEGIVDSFFFTRDLNNGKVLSFWRGGNNEDKSFSRGMNLNFI